MNAMALHIESASVICFHLFIVDIPQERTEPLTTKYRSWVSKIVLRGKSYVHRLPVSSLTYTCQY